MSDNRKESLENRESKTECLFKKLNLFLSDITQRDSVGMFLTEVERFAESG